MTQSTIPWPVHGNLRDHDLSRCTYHFIKSLSITYPKTPGTAVILDELPIEGWALCTYTLTFPPPIVASNLMHVLTYYAPFWLLSSAHHNTKDKRHQLISSRYETMYIKCTQNMNHNAESTQTRNTRSQFRGISNLNALCPVPLVMTWPFPVLVPSHSYSIGCAADFTALRNTTTAYTQNKWHSLCSDGAVPFYVVHHLSRHTAVFVCILACYTFPISSRFRARCVHWLKW